MRDRQADRGKRTGKLSGLRSALFLYLSKLLNRWHLSTSPHWQHCCRSWNITECPEFINTLQAAFCAHSTVLSTVSLAHPEVGHDTICQIKDWNAKEKKNSKVKAQLEFLWFIQTVKMITLYLGLQCCFVKLALLASGHPGRNKDNLISSFKYSVLGCSGFSVKFFTMKHCVNPLVVHFIVCICIYLSICVKW